MDTTCPLSTPRAYIGLFDGETVDYVLSPATFRIGEQEYAYGDVQELYLDRDNGDLCVVFYDASSHYSADDGENVGVEHRMTFSKTVLRAFQSVFISLVQFHRNFMSQQEETEVQGEVESDAEEGDGDVFSGSDAGEFSENEEGQGESDEEDEDEGEVEVEVEGEVLVEEEGEETRTRADQEEEGEGEEEEAEEGAEEGEEEEEGGEEEEDQQLDQIDDEEEEGEIRPLTISQPFVSVDANPDTDTDSVPAIPPHIDVASESPESPVPSAESSPGSRPRPRSRPRLRVVGRIASLNKARFQSIDTCDSPAASTMVPLSPVSRSKIAALQQAADKPLPFGLILGLFPVTVLPVGSGTGTGAGAGSHVSAEGEGEAEGEGLENGPEEAGVGVVTVIDEKNPERTEFTLFMKEDFLFLDEIKFEYADIVSFSRVEGFPFSSSMIDETGSVYDVVMRSPTKEIVHRWHVLQATSDFEEIMKEMVEMHTGAVHDAEMRGLRRRIAHDRRHVLDGIDPAITSVDWDSIPDDEDFLRVLRQCVFEGNRIELRENLSKNKASLRNLHDLFVHCIHAHRSDCLEELLDHCPVIHEIGCPMQLAISYFYTDPVAVILRHKAKILSPDFTPLHSAAVEMKQLGRGIDRLFIDETDSDGWTAMHLCAIVNNVEMLKSLCEAGANSEIADKEDSRTPLHMAAIFGNLECLKILIAHHANQHSFTMQGMTVLHLCSEYGRTQAVRFLLQPRGFIQLPLIDPDERSLKGDSALLVAARNSQVDVVSVLLEKGLDPNEDIDRFFNGVLHCVCAQPYCKDSDREIVNTLVEYDGNVEKVNLQGETPLYVALLHSCELEYVKGKDYVDVLVENHAQWNPCIRELVKSNDSARRRYLQLLQQHPLFHFKALVYDEKLARCKSRCGHTLHGIGGDRLLLIGGYNPRVSRSKKTYYSNELLLFGTRARKRSSGAVVGGWSRVRVRSQDKPVARAHHTSVLFKNRLFVYGGETCQVRARADFWLFDIASRRWLVWKRPADTLVPPPLSKHSAVIAFTPSYDPWLLDARASVLKERLLEYRKFPLDFCASKDLPDAPNVVPGSQRMIMYGGQTPDSSPSSEVWMYDFAKNSWSKEPNGPPARRGHSAVYHARASLMVVFGGYGQRTLNDTWTYHCDRFVTSRVRTGGDCPPERTGHCAILCGGDRMFVHGGHSGRDILGDLFCLNLRNWVWHEIQIDSLSPRWNIAMAFLNECEPALVGGRNGVVNLVHLPTSEIELECYSLHESEVGGDDDDDDLRSAFTVESVETWVTVTDDGSPD